MELTIVWVGVLMAVLILGGSICGLIAVIRMAALGGRLRKIEEDLSSLRLRMQQRADVSFAAETMESPVSEAAVGPSAPGTRIGPEPRVAQPPGPGIVAQPPPAVSEPPGLAAAKPAEPHPSPPAPPIPPPRAFVPPPPRRPPVSFPSFSFEQILGTRLLVWVGMVLILIGGGFFLKYAYDNAWIGPRGRLAIGASLSLAALALGERFRRRGWGILFQTLTGGGLAGFYICIFFSFQIYHLSTQGPAFGLAILVTALAVALAVGHDALPIAILALIGGFLSPVLLSTGANHPYALFTFIAVLDLVALGAAWHRRWPALDVLAFIGTATIYLGWHSKFYGRPDQPSQMLPALLYTTLFYLMFLVIPSLYSLVRRLVGREESLILLVLNAVYSFYCYYEVLYVPYRHVLGFVVMGQALLVFALFLIWQRRLGEDRRAVESLLAIALALVVIAVPIQLRFYAIPIAWAAEGTLFAYLGVRFSRLLLRLAGLAALGLAAWGLLDRLPLHAGAVLFVPAWNVPFGSWIAVIAAAGGAAWLLKRGAGLEDAPYLAAIAFLIGFSLACGLLSLEVDAFWSIRQPIVYQAVDASGRPNFEVHNISSLIVLWALISLAALPIVKRLPARPAWMVLMWLCWAIATWLCVGGFFDNYVSSSRWFGLNWVFAPRLALVLAMWWGALYLERIGEPPNGQALAAVGHVLLVILLAVEIHRWGRNCTWLSERMAMSLISAAWGLQAFALIVLGLARRRRALRILGFLLFGATLVKVCFVDMATLDKVFRIVSFIGSGLFMLGAGYFYQRFSPMFLGEDTRENES